MPTSIDTVSPDSTPPTEVSFTVATATAMQMVSISELIAAVNIGLGNAEYDNSRQRRRGPERREVLINDIIAA
ncbi:MAG: hypothetical protein U0802_07690 [Candidatus Binatia bacterium]